MIHESSQSEDGALSHFENNKLVSQENKVKDTKSVKSPHIIDKQTNSNQINLLHQLLWFWQRYSRWSYFYRGLFWGGVITSTAIFWGGCGVALTKIDAVEQAIAKMINYNSPEVQSLTVEGGERLTQASLTRPVNILLMEVEPDADKIVKFSPAFVGKNKIILLLKFEPQMGLAQVINIPTNSRVKIPEFGWGTIADANQYGGTKLVLQIVGQLLNDITIDRYIRATPQTFEQLSASGKLTLNRCNYRVQDCSKISEQIIRQQTAFETIRQHLNIPAYLAGFKATVAKINPNLDTNLSVLEIISLANFVGELDSDSISVDLLPGYVPGKTVAINNLHNQSPLVKEDLTMTKTAPASSNKYYSFQNFPIAVQNTTDRPELGMEVLAYLRRQNFQNVYLAEHIPLKLNKTKLNKTKIIVDHNQLQTANYLPRNAAGHSSFRIH